MKWGSNIFYFPNTRKQAVWWSEFNAPRVPLIHSTPSPCGLASMVTLRVTQLGSQQWLTKRAMLPFLVASTMSPEDASTVNI